MKREIINLVAALGLVLLGAAAVVGIITGILFIFPDTTIMGAKAVNERDTEIVYRDPALTEAFKNGNIILESVGTQIEVQMSSSGFVGDGTIGVKESATGIAFNSLSRTLIEWTQTIYNEELYYRIKILEPSGVVFNQKPTVVYINLPHCAPSDDVTYNFVLQNQYSTVNFSFIDNTTNQSDALKINQLVVESAASVNLPSAENMTVNSVEIKGNNTKFNCQATVLGDVKVTSSRGTQNFAKIGGTVTVKGGNENRFHGDSAGNVIFENNNGSLSMNDVKKLTVKTTSAEVAVGNAKNGVEMATVYGNLRVGKITSGGLSFMVGSADAPFGKASVSVDSELTGYTSVRNYGIGSVNLYGVNGDVDVRSCQPGGGEINVSFKESATGCEVVIRGYDGNINVRGINGWANIEVNNRWQGAAAANIKAHFRRVVNKADGTPSLIWSGGYVNGHDDWGNVEIELSDGCNNFDMYVYGARSANSEPKYGYADNDMHVINDATDEKGNPIIISKKEEESSSGRLEIHTQNKLHLY